MPITIPRSYYNPQNLDYQNPTVVMNEMCKNAMSGSGEVHDVLLLSDPGGYYIEDCGNLLLRSAATLTATLSSAARICRNLPQPINVNQQFRFTIAATSGATVTLASVPDVTLNCVTSITTGLLVEYRGVITQAYTTRVSRIDRGYRNISFFNNRPYGYRITIAGNTTAPVVGTLIYINVTSGTLPSGWYPISKVSSATVFEITTPNTDFVVTDWSFDNQVLTAPQWCPLIEVNTLYTQSGISF